MTRSSVLVIGAGGLGSAASLVLARSGVPSLTLVDDDVVDASNLHRQLLYEETDVGRPKGAAAVSAIERASRGGTRARWFEGRFTPDTAIALVEAHDVVVEGADNFATKFLAADACRIADRPLVSAGAVRWSGFVLASAPGRGACLRCVFEDLPRDREETCAVAGVVGAVVGVLGALQAALAIRALEGDERAAGELFAYDGLAGSLRRLRPRPRAGCDGCSGRIDNLDEKRYQSASPT